MSNMGRGLGLLYVLILSFLLDIYGYSYLVQILYPYGCRGVSVKLPAY